MTQDKKTIDIFNSYSKIRSKLFTNQNKMRLRKKDLKY